MVRKQPHPITKEDFNKLIDEAKKERDKYWMPRSKRFKPTGERIQDYIIAMCLGFGAGLRISEIFGLKKAQIYKYKKKNEKTAITRTIYSNIPALNFDFFEFNTRFIYLPLRKKGKYGRVPIPTKTFRQAGITKEELKRKLPLQSGARACQRYFTDLCKKVLKKHSTFHQLRHGFVTHALESGLDIHEVQVFAGHSRIDTTGQYLHSNPTKARDKYEEVF